METVIKMKGAILVFIFTLASAKNIGVQMENSNDANRFGDCVEFDYDYMGGDITRYANIQNWQKCNELCVGNPLCLRWTWLSPKYPVAIRRLRCYLKKRATGHRFRSSGAVSGIRCKEATTGIPTITTIAATTQVKTTGVTKGVVFRVVGFAEEVDVGWRIASISDVQRSLGVVRSILGKENKWIICKLVDGSIFGSGYGYKIDRTYKLGWKNKLIVNLEATTGRPTITTIAATTQVKTTGVTKESLVEEIKALRKEMRVLKSGFGEAVDGLEDQLSSTAKNLSDSIARIRHDVNENTNEIEKLVKKEPIVP